MLVIAIWLLTLHQCLVLALSALGIYTICDRSTEACGLLSYINIVIYTLKPKLPKVAHLCKWLYLTV